jgi:SpoVK/Ycf46/Vps4 family AAA+-type ATPase
MSNQDFNRIWKDTIGTYAPCICLFEDIDGVFDGRENVATRGKMDQGLSFDCFLNCLDGVENTDGLFIVVSTNNIDKLDNAIGVPNNGDGMSTRPGRIDRTLFFDSLDENGREKMANRILGDFDKDKWSFILDEGGNYNDTGAQFQERCCRLALKLFWDK